MSTITDAAFGADPGRWPLATPSTPEEQWQRAVAAGGQGRYACATADLDAVLRSHPAGRLASLALSTQASFLRQLGDHVSARTWDGRAWAQAGTDPTARADALIGLAADALGVGRFALAGELLRRAGTVIGDDGSGRLPVRLAWVGAELAMFTGHGTSAVAHAERAVELAAHAGSARHVVKSQLVLAAARCSAGDVDTSRGLADEALTATDRLGLTPLGWAVACLLTDIGSAAHSPGRMAAIRTRLAETVRVRGGAWSAR